jgi:hypothetical protein
MVHVWVQRNRRIGNRLFCKTFSQAGVGLGNPDRFILVKDRRLPDSNKMFLGPGVPPAKFLPGDVLGPSEDLARGGVLRLTSHKSRCLRIFFIISESSINEIIFIDPEHLGHNNGSTLYAF